MNRFQFKFFTNNLIFSTNLKNHKKKYFLCISKMLCYCYEQSIFNIFNVKSIYNSKSLIIQYLVKGLVLYTHVKLKKK